MTEVFHLLETDSHVSIYDAHQFPGEEMMLQHLVNSRGDRAAYPFASASADNRDSSDPSTWHFVL